ncbi:MAG: glucoamylase family protein [Actinomycetota bacterium]|nr:glucoamylase family protein [Actinomycetota bacterium]
MARAGDVEHWSMPPGDEPLRTELLGSERLSEAARGLASGQQWTAAESLRATPLLSLLERAEESLHAVYNHLAIAARDQIPVSVSAEWLLDNFYMVEEQIRTVRDDLPDDYGTELPRLTAGALRDFPRVFEAVALLVASTDARLDREHLVRFVTAFQDVSPLTIGEVWAVPIMLRVCLVESLRRVGLRVLASHDAGVEADAWANRILAAAQQTPATVAGLVRDLERSQRDAPGAFLIRLLHRLQDQDPAVESTVAWIERTLAGRGATFQQLTLTEHQEQAVDQVSVANAITSIRFLGALEWREFFEECSLVEHVLREDPAGVYSRMDFVSRDRYRHAIEELADRSDLSEIGVAEAVMSHALEALRRDASDPIGGHVGQYLISSGRYRLEKSIGYRPRARELAYRGPLASKGLIYWGLLGTITALLALGLGAYLTGRGVSAGWIIALMMLSLVPLSDLAINVVNRVAASVWPARMLPKLDYRKPVAAAHRTMVAIPALLTSASGTQAIIDNLEIAYLANRDQNVIFGLVGDLRGGADEVQPGDAAVIDAARSGIAALNETYGENGCGPFHLFVRARRYNKVDNVWMGWERKRGALHEFSQLLRGAPDTSFSVREGDAAALPEVTFVITLDADTVLPRDAARKLISTIAHPLNRAQLDASKRRVVRGYGLVQPRVGMSLEGAERSPFAWLYSGVTGVDPYAGAVSDTYQDVFGEGSFTGKGIFEVDVMNAVLENRFPENTLLSHDLLEGCYLRTALASDVEVLDDQPASYVSHSARLHRWVRGDWQTLPWLGFTVPTPNGRERNPLSAINRWKIIDNLRRSVLAPAMMLFAGAGWFVLPGRDWVWLAAVFAIVLFPVYFSIADSLLFRPRGADVRGDTHSIVSDFWRDSARALLSLSVLPHQAAVMLDAIIRALWRMLFSHHNMLEWETAAEVERRLGSTSAGFLRRMWTGELVVATIALPAAITDPASLVSAAPLLLAWVLAPYAAWRVSVLTPHEPPVISAADTAALRRIARKTWRFFETFVTVGDHWLAPDNFQEDPKGVVAHRTSPTNIGLQLISALTAYDLGYISVSGLVERESRTLSTMAGMERFRGHFFNWYDTETLQPLRPGYLSTVDSGNLAGHLIVLRTGLTEVAERPLIGPQVLNGLADTVRTALEDLLGQRDRVGPGAVATELRTSLEELLRRIRLDSAPSDLGEWHVLLTGLAAVTDTLPARLSTLTGEVDSLEVIRSAVDAVRRDLNGHLSDLETYTPWARLISTIPPALREGETADLLAPMTRNVPSLVGLAEGLDPALGELTRIASGDDAVAAAWALKLADSLRERRTACVNLLAELRLDAEMAREMWEKTDFRMLFDSSRMVFSIGFNTAEGRLDNSFYDMLASECRLASYVAIAKGDVPQEHWFRLGRGITKTDGGRALVSWSASMFEYLMPLLVMKTWPGTLLDQTYRSVVKRQIQYGRQRGVAWGVSESAFNAKDVELTYQYQAFGVPGLGLKRGLSEDVVVAPYASVLALPVNTRAALDNLDALSRLGAEGRYGYFEAVDYTPGRVPAGKERAIVKAYMAHHQGMSLVAIGNMLTHDHMQERFHADPSMHAAELLLQERVPRRIQLAQPHVEEVAFIRSVREIQTPLQRSYPLAGTPVPSTHFLSNGSYSVMVTNGGGGYSRWRDDTVTRYREDVTRDNWGMFFYLKDVENGAVWSAAFQPSLAEPDEYHVTFSADKAEYRRIDGDVETHTEVVVSPADDVEVRRITVTNRRREPLLLEVTSYFEVTLAERGADHAHKAFSNLFMETEAVPEFDALLFSRRPRSAHEERPWGVHALACDLGEKCNWTYETDREAFLGRLHTPTDPHAIAGGGRLTGTVGAVIDPICSIRQTLTIEPGATARLAFATGVAETREGALALAERYHDIRAAQRALDLAWSTSQIELRDLGITPEEAVVFQRLASRLLLTDPRSRLKVLTAVENRSPMSGLWSIGISGDDPILLVKIERLEETPLVRQALLAHQYWRSKGFECDLVILNTKPSAYSSELDGRLRMLLRTGHALELQDRPRGVHLRAADQMPAEVANLLDSVARAVLTGDSGPIGLQLNLRAVHAALPDPLTPRAAPVDDPAPLFERPVLENDNGYGGFDPATGEYVIILEGARTTPAPWVNVLANPTFGALVSEAGIGCTWAQNSHENRITTWNNDPVSDGTGEVFYVRDEETGEFWSPTPLPVRSTEPYTIRHGHGYTRFEHTSHGISHELDWFVAAADPVRVVQMRLTNNSDRVRHLSITHFIEWALGDSRSRAQQRVVTWWDDDAHMLLAHNWFNLDFPGLPAFLACDCEADSYTASRTEFIGRNGDPRDPAAMHRRTLGGSTGRFIDNCGAIMRKLTLEPGVSTTITFLLGQTETVEEAHDLVRRYREPGTATTALADVCATWGGILGAVEVSTPDAALDRMINGQALHQALACRFWGRTATYQSSGAFGFRDQLQDCLALLYTRQDLVREHIIEAARHQFPEGDVLHWWQPVSGRGVRTRFADDRLWLPFVVAEYVRSTGDATVLDVEVPYLEGPTVPDDREDLYLQVQPSLRVASVYEHCCAAIEVSSGIGDHGLPLMGGGDWNDGMNRVGIGGKGESVWMAWFLDVVLRTFAPIADSRGEAALAETCRERAAAFVAAIEREAWDGAWYRRAFFDDGTPLGSKFSEECKIDAIAQAWATISGSGDPSRAQRALESVEEKLVRWDDGLVALLAPPFDHMAQDPGYIKGYVPGVRENGGQYTHAAVWVALAYALVGDGDEAVALLDLINPINHALDEASADRYRVEPYVLAADVYAVEPHTGRGGWTWYTGSASWYYRVAVRDILGLHLEADDGVRYLRVDPCVPKSWTSYRMTFRDGATTYEIAVENPRGTNRGVERVLVDGVARNDMRVPLLGDGGSHEVRVTLLGG